MRPMLLVLLVTAAAAAAHAQPKPPQPQAGDIVRLEGCVEAGVEFKCVMLHSGGVTYDVTGLGVKPGDYLHGAATVTPRANTCMQGVIVSQYKPDGQAPKRCAADPAAR